MYQIVNKSKCDRGIHVRSGDVRGLVSVPTDGSIQVSDEDLADMRKNAQFRIWVDAGILEVSKVSETEKPEGAPQKKASKTLKTPQEVVRTGFEE
jgi:hypothetical protein